MGPPLPFIIVGGRGPYGKQNNRSITTIPTLHPHLYSDEGPP